jgi:site-specific recombinase XerD
MTLRRTKLESIFEAHLQTLALTSRPWTMAGYRSTTRLFLTHLHVAFPQVHQLSQLRRDPHLLSWFRSLSEQQPPLTNQTRICYLLRLRRLLDDLAANGHSIQPGLIRREDFPPPTRYLPRPLPLRDDQLLLQELRRSDDLAANALLLIRATGMRISECTQLTLDCLRQLGPHQWALHIPLGKLHTERLLPADDEIRQIVARILALRALTPPDQLAKSQSLLLPSHGGYRCGYRSLCGSLRLVLARIAQRAGCSTHVTPHRMRHNFATEMLRLGVSLPALMQLLGHKDIRMTLRYVQITQQDLQREFHQARQNVAHPHCLPTLPLPRLTQSIESGDLLGIRQALVVTRHLLEMYRRQLGDEKTKCKLERLDRRLLAVASELERIAIPVK